MKRFIQGEHRGQSTLLPESLDDYALLLEFKVPELHAENPVHAKHKSSSKALGT